MDRDLRRLAVVKDRHCDAAIVRGDREGRALHRADGKLQCDARTTVGPEPADGCVSVQIVDTRATDADKRDPVEETAGAHRLTKARWGINEEVRRLTWGRAGDRAPVGSHEAATV